MPFFSLFANRGGDGLHRAQQEFIRETPVGQARRRWNEERNIGCDGFAIILIRGIGLVDVDRHLPERARESDLNEESSALRRQVLHDVAALPNASIYVWYEQGADSTAPVSGVFPNAASLRDHLL